MKYLLGIDGGGTKTALCAVSLDDNEIKYAVTSGTSWREHGVDGVAGKLKEAAHKLTGGSINGIAMGLPCYGESRIGDEALAQAIHQEFPGIPIYITNDVEVGWAGSLALEPGINIVAGTGSIAFGRDESGKTARNGGWSEFFSDEGSCYWMGRKVLEMYSKQADGRIPKDALYDIVCRAFGIADDFDIIDPIHNEYMPYREKVASLQMLANEAAELGSACVLALYKEAVGELTLMVSAIKNQLNFLKTPFTVSYSGGLFKAGGFVLPLYSQEVERLGGKLAAPVLKPEEGALLLACEQFSSQNFEKVKKMLMEQR